MALRCQACAALVVLVSLAALGSAHARDSAAVRVTLFGDSAATAVAYDPDARRILGRGIDLRLEVAACRRVGDASCPYDGVRPPNVIERATELGSELGRVVVVVVGYNDYENRYAGNIEEALDVFRKAGVERVLWATLRAERQSYVTMNEAIVAAARKHSQLTVLDWNALGRANPDWLQPDGIHLTPQGAQGMATMINGALVELGVAPKPQAPKRPSFAIVSKPLTIAHRGRSYSASLRAVGGTGPYRWARIGGVLAPGLRLGLTGRLVGIPTRAGTFTFRARVVDRTGAARARVFLLRVL